MMSNYPDTVLWIRNDLMTHQIYISPSHEKIWETDINLIYTIPYIWFDFLEKNHKETSMLHLQSRHNSNYEDRTNNIVHYPILTPAAKTKYIRDQCVKCRSVFNKKYIVGFAREISFEDSLKNLHDFSLTNYHQELYEKISVVLVKKFGIIAMEQKNISVDTFENIAFLLEKKYSFTFSRREIACLYSLCQGKTAKQTAIELSISYRTVETYLQSVRDKTGSKNKFELINQLGHLGIMP